MRVLGLPWKRSQADQHWRAQGARYGLIKEYTLNHLNQIRDPNIV